MFRNPFHIFAVTTVSACALLAPASAMAQSATANAETENSGTTSQMPEILVTAQKRTERLRDVPITITQLSGERLAQTGVTNALDLSRVTPGLRLERQGSYVQPALRGITTTFTSINDSPIAVYIDGIYQSSLSGLNIEFSDIKDIEVLKGPQGTLFGRNASGGAIQIFTRDPEFDASGKVSASYGNFNDVQVKAFVTAPLSDKIAFSLSGAVHNNDGYLHDIEHGNARIGSLKTKSVRGKLLLKPTENLSIKLTGFYSKNHDSTIIAAPYKGNTLYGNNPLIGPIPTKPYEVVVDFPYNTNNLTTSGGNLKMDLDTGIGTITSLTGYTRYRIVTPTDIDRVVFKGYEYYGGGYSITPFFTERAYSQELTLASRRFGPLSFVTGLYYFHGKNDALQSFQRMYPTVLSQDVYTGTRIDAAAVYGEATLQATDKLSLVAGLRYSDEKRRFVGGIIVTPAGGPAPASRPVLSKRHDSDITPRLVAKYQITDEMNVYASYTEGFKSGTYNSTAIPVQQADPEKVKAYEVGSKGRFGSFDYSVAGFYYDYRNIQTSAFIVSPDGRQGQLYANAARGEIYGVEASATLAVTDDFNLNANASLLSAKYKSFPNAIGYRVNANGFGDTIIQPFNATGNHLIRAPAFTANVNATYDVHIEDSLLRLFASVYYTSKYYFESDNRLFQPGYALLDARASWTPAHSHVTFSVWGKNLTDRAIPSTLYGSAFGDVVAWSSPRKYGVAIDYDF